MTTDSAPPDRVRIYKYRIDKTLGQGGSGTVYRGLDPETGKVFAVKLFRANFFANKMHERDFAGSVQHFIKFNHINVTKIYDFLTGDEGAALVMEFVDGFDLKYYIENRTWDLRERIVVCSQICNGLQYIHDQGYTHHDLKPANILLTRRGVVKLSDYSLARAKLFALFETTHSELITPMYIAPELLRKEKSTHKADLYSLGVTMYLMFVGHHPFQVDNLAMLYHCHQKIMPEHPTVMNKRCPKALGDIIMKMLEKKPENRFENCDQLRIAMANIGRSKI
jgi:serine/threonine protein kinase